MFQQLAKPIAVAFGGVHRMKRLNDKQAVVGVVEFQLVDHAARYNEVVTVRKIDVAHLGTQLSRTFVDENDFVGIGIFVEVVFHALRRCSELEVNVRVH